MGILSAAILVKHFNDFCIAYRLLKVSTIVVHFIISNSISLTGDISQCAENSVVQTEFINWFPNNLLRNVARNVSEIGIEWFVLLDVDLVPSGYLYQTLDAFVRRGNVSNLDIYLILVFEAREGVSNIDSKLELTNLFNIGEIKQFHSWCNVCYGYYDYKKWLSLGRDSHIKINFIIICGNRSVSNIITM